MAYQQGSLRKAYRKAGDVWLLRYRTTKPDGTRVENTITVGPVSKFKNESDARREAARLGLLAEINAEVQTRRIAFEALAEHYLKADFGDGAVRKKSATTIPIVQHYVRDYLVPRWKDAVAEEVKPYEIQLWLLSLNTRAEDPLAWPTIAKIKAIMNRVYKVGMLHDLVSKNPVQCVETQSKSNYRAIDITPQQTLAILQRMKSQLHYALVLTCAATALRASELLSLRWSDILWNEDRIQVSKRWAKGADGETKTEASDAYVPLHSLLAGHLREWKRQTPHPKETDFVFPSLTANGRVPMWACNFVADYLRPAAIAAGVDIPTGKRFGLHNLRHSLSNWLITKSKTDPKTVQELLRHANVRTTLQLYARSDSTETRAAQGVFLDAVGISQATA
ncbi:MAG TPA: site-specific integrase [Terriglobales bacterium]|jgi:integrase|nr:site-specific integrase [Terriglobales bacterium]